MCSFHIRYSSKTTTRKTTSLACSVERLFIFIEVSRADRFCHGRKSKNSDLIKLRCIDITVKFWKSKKHIVLFSYSARIFDCYNGKQVWVWKLFSFPELIRGSLNLETWEQLVIYIRELKHATFLSHGRTPEVYCFPILLVFTLPHLYF